MNMSTTAIQFDHVGKLYKLGLVGTGTLSHDLNRWWKTTVLRQEDPYLKIGETNDRSKKGSSDYVWALKDITFDVKQGDVVGIIGKNGAGKSTLLKLLSRVTSPTTGVIRARGRIASLLEVGTGFHPELTGRENIYMNGSIMGMTRQEITRKLDEIVDFAGVERYVDTPVKRYSSGMTVRLGFAVAAFLEPEILVVDEVLAVGDAEFQKKAIGKMQDVSKGEGRTVLFVSHNMAAVKMLCNNGIVLNNGTIDMVGAINECVERYISNAQSEIRSHCVITEKNRQGNGLYSRKIEIVEVWLNNANPAEIATDEPLDMIIRLKRSEGYEGNFQIGVVISNVEGVRVAYYLSEEMVSNKDREFKLQITIPHHSLPKGIYTIKFEALLVNFNTGGYPFDYANNALCFEIKYIHKELHDEYLHWKSSWGLRLHRNDQFVICPL